MVSLDLSVGMIKRGQFLPLASSVVNLKLEECTYSF